MTFHILGMIIPTDSYFLEGLKPTTRLHGNYWDFMESWLDLDGFDGFYYGALTITIEIHRDPMKPLWFHHAPGLAALDGWDPSHRRFVQVGSGARAAGRGAGPNVAPWVTRHHGAVLTQAEATEATKGSEGIGCITEVRSLDLGLFEHRIPGSKGLWSLSYL